MTRPDRAISIKQPWAWAIIHADKDVENRKRPSRFQAAVGRRIYVHASKGMTRAEYADAAEFMASIGVRCPAPANLEFGGIIGSVLVTSIVTQHRSKWFGGPAALALADPRPEPFVPMRGRLGLWRVEEEEEWTVAGYVLEAQGPSDPPMTSEQIHKMVDGVGRLMGWTQ